jgi:riboflavin synthase
MFTGVIARVGKVVSVCRRGSQAAFAVSSRAIPGGLSPGDSVSVNGVCQTVTSIRGDEFSFDAVSETLGRTNLGRLSPGSEVNLEAALRMGDRIGGHLVSGHVDATGIVRRRRVVGGANVDYVVQVPDELAPYVRPKGSISLDGVSLTVKDVRGGMVGVTVIPFTVSNTIIRNWRVGTVVNVEVDQLAKYLSPGGEIPGGRKA